MASLQALYLNPLLLFVLILTRLSGLLMTAPILGTRDVPMQVRALLAIGLSLLVTPLYWAQPVDAENLIQLLALLVQEAALGLSIGMSIAIIFSGLQLAGQVIGQMSGLSLADVFDPTFDTTVPVFSQILHLAALAVFVIIGGHRDMLAKLLDSFSWMPPGRVELSNDVLEALLAVLTQSVVLGIQASAPAIMALLLAVLILGLISRTLPQLNVLAVGLSLNTVVMMVTLALSFGTLIWVFQGHVAYTLEVLHSTLADPVP